MQFSIKQSIVYPMWFSPKANRLPSQLCPCFWCSQVCLLPPACITAIQTVQTVILRASSSRGCSQGSGKHRHACVTCKLIQAATCNKMDEAIDGNYVDVRLLNHAVVREHTTMLHVCRCQSTYVFHVICYIYLNPQSNDLRIGQLRSVFQPWAGIRFRTSVSNATWQHRGQT